MYEGNKPCFIKGRIKSSGVVLPLDRIEEDGTIILEGGFKGSPDEIELIDNIEYDQYRPQFAGMAMQAMWSGIIQSPLLMEQMAKRAAREGFANVSELIANDATAHADNLIAALKKPRQIQAPKKDLSNEIGENDDD